MDGSDLAQDRDQWRALVNMAMNLHEDGVVGTEVIWLRIGICEGLL
jgi:hypothetical protein